MMGRTMKLLLDTHTIVHHAQKSPHFRDEVYEAIDNPVNDVSVSAITAGELACLIKRNRLQLPSLWSTWFQKLIADNEWQCLPVTLEIMVEAFSLPEPIHNDPADRILIATARINDLCLVTLDHNILQYSHVSTLH
jgi:PIN domain nuclease of toxin-antitoxin system